MPHVLVTGGAGFLGSHLCDALLAEGNRVTCLDNFYTGQKSNLASALTSPLFDLMRHDVEDPIRMEVDAIYHLACPASPVHYQRNPVRTLLTAVRGTQNVLDLARETGARVVIASTSEVYGDPDVHPQREHYWGNVNPVGKRACYDEGKRCGETMAVCYRERYGVDVRIARIFNTYGPRMRENDGRIVSNLCTQAIAGEPLTIYGNGLQTRSLCFVSDLIDGLMRLMALNKQEEPVNLGNDQELTVLEVATLILELTASKSQPRFYPLPSDDPRRRRPDISRAREVLGWQPKVSVKGGLAATVRYFAERVPQKSNGGARVHPLPPTLVAR